MLQLPTVGSAPARALRPLQVLWEQQNLFKMFLSPGALRDSGWCMVGVMQGLLFIAFHVSPCREESLHKRIRSYQIGE